METIDLAECVETTYYDLMGITQSPKFEMQTELDDNEQYTTVWSHNGVYYKIKTNLIPLKR